MRENRGQRSAAWLLLVLGLIGAGLGWYATGSLQRDHLDARAAARADAMATQLLRNLERDVAAVAGLTLWVDDPTELSQDEWTSALETLRATGAFTDVAAVNLAILVDADAAGALDDLLPTGTDLRLSDHARHAVITRVWPEEFNAAAYGFDVYGNPAAAAAVDRALLVGRARASAPLELVQEPGEQRATVIYLPVGGDDPTAVATIAFRAGALLEEVLDRETNVAATWFDGPEVLAHVDGPSVGTADATLTALGRRWTVRVGVAHGELSIGGRLAPLAVAVSLVSLSVLAGAFLVAGRRGERRARELAEQRTEELAAATDRLRAANAELQQLDEVKDRMFHAVSHDLRSPLTVIRGLSDLLALTAEDDELRDGLQRIGANAERLERMLGDLLTAAQLRHADVPVDHRPLDLTAVVRAVTVDLGIGTVTGDLGPAPHVAADADHITRIVQNLLSNAAKYGEPPYLVQLAIDDDAVEVRVRDHGPGIPVEDRDAVFAAFTQLDGRTSGAGLGLAIARELTELQHGQLRYEDPADGGAAFVVELPRLRAGGHVRTGVATTTVHDRDAGSDRP